MSEGEPIDTLGKLRANHMGLVWYCNACNRRLSLTLDDAIGLWGADQCFVQWHPPIRCSGCGSRDVSCRVQAQVPGR